MAKSERPSKESVAWTHADSLLASAVLRGDGDAFARIINRHQAKIADQMRRFSRDPLVIEELVHEVFVEAYTSLKSFRSDAPLVHWLRKIAVRVGYRYWKHQSRHAGQSVSLSSIEERLSQFSIGEQASMEASETLGGLLELLSPSDRLVLTLIYWDGCSVAEAAELSGWTKANVKIRAHRARKRLGKLIEESLR